MTTQLSFAAVSAASVVMDEKTIGPRPEIAGLVYCAVNKEGNTIFSHASGQTGSNIQKPMSLDTIFWLASCTKLITSIACMQLVEQGELRLDDVALVDSLAPELRDVEVLERTTVGEFCLVPKQRGITLRMLLAHTSGFGYAFDDLKLRDWSRPIGLDDFSGFESDILQRPLVNQPGTSFQYGAGVDWAGVLVERVTGISLEEYFQKFILHPLHIESITFFPSQSMKARLAYMHQRELDGSLSIRDHLYRYPLLPCKSGEKQFCMGGAGCFGKPVEYCRLIGALLNDGTSPNTGYQLLKPETVKEMFTDQIPHMPRHCNDYSPAGKPLLANSCPLVRTTEDLTEGWGLSFSLSHTKSPTGRSAGSGSWEGLANLFWFADRENGIGGIVASQILPYGGKYSIRRMDSVFWCLEAYSPLDLDVLGCSERVEKIIYDDLCKDK